METVNGQYMASAGDSGAREVVVPGGNLGKIPGESDGAHFL